MRRDDVADLAILRADALTGLEPLELARNADLYQTMRVVTFGFPFGTLLAFDNDQSGKFPEVSINVSHVTTFEWVIVQNAFDPQLVPSVNDQSNLSLVHTHHRELAKVVFDGQINPGNSGGPVLDRHGKVVGVATATIPGAAINFAVPADRLSAFLKVARPECHRAGPRLGQPRRAVEVEVQSRPTDAQGCTPRRSLGRRHGLGRQ